MNRFHTRDWMKQKNKAHRQSWQKKTVKVKGQDGTNGFPSTTTSKFYTFHKGRGYSLGRSQLGAKDKIVEPDQTIAPRKAERSGGDVRGNLLSS